MFLMIGLLLNCNGLGSVYKKSWIKGLAENVNPVFFGIQEIKLDSVDQFLVRSLWPCLFVSSTFSSSVGASGGIITMWDSRVFNMENKVTNRNFLGVVGSWSGVSSKVGLLKVYAPQLSSLKSQLWSTIEGVINFLDAIWILFGDFNVVRSQDEHLGSTFDVNEANFFNDFIARVGLFDFPLGGRRFTRFDNNGRSASKLNRYMVSNKFFDFWNDAAIFVPCRSLSDHCPIALKKLFPLLASHGSTFTPDLALKNKLKCLRQAIKVWTFNQTATKNNLKDDLVRKLLGWDERAEFKEIDSPRPTFNIPFFCKLSSHDAIYLDSILTVEEVKEAVWGCAGSKASGLDSSKKGALLGFSDYRPISLIGRKILDGNLIANEVIRMASIENLKLLLFKVDFEKAFDSFKLKRGLHQGYLLSPFLFLIVAEALQISILEACDKGFYKGVYLAENKSNLSLLQYADDALFFGYWSRLNASNLIHILECFELASGLKVNIAKSRLLVVGVPNIEVELMASLLGCTHDSLHFTYLGLPVGKKMRACDGWNPILSRFKDRLSSWKAKSLSIGGRLTLVKFVLQSLPIYYLSLFKAPQKSYDELSSLISLIGNIFPGSLWDRQVDVGV
ncbi:RNA-directed DNA polymerase, eukaryota [Tanacetum coccineum]